MTCKIIKDTENVNVTAYPFVNVHQVKKLYILSINFLQTLK